MKSIFIRFIYLISMMIIEKFEEFKCIHELRNGIFYEIPWKLII